MIKAIAKVGLAILTPKIWCTWRNSGPRSGTWRNSILTYFSNSRSVFGQINALKSTTLIYAVKSINIIILLSIAHFCACACVVALRATTHFLHPAELSHWLKGCLDHFFWLALCRNGCQAETLYSCLNHLMSGWLFWLDPLVKIRGSLQISCWFWSLRAGFT